MSLYHRGNIYRCMIHISNHLNSAPMDDMTNARMACRAQSGRRVCNTRWGGGGGGGGGGQGCVSLVNTDKVAGEMPLQ
jgi:hypothetical protein